MMVSIGAINGIKQRVALIENDGKVRQSYDQKWKQDGYNNDEQTK